MSFPGLLQILLFIVVLLAVTKPMGAYMARVYQGRRTFLSPVLQPAENGIYRVCGVRPDAEQHWTIYAAAMLLFNLAGLLLLYAIQRLQDVLPYNPAGLPAVEPGSAFNTAVSFTTNTNWQGYVGEATMSYLTQATGLAVHNFISAATGMAVAIALVRGLTRRSAQEIGNFWVDLVRSTLYILLPLSIVFALAFVARGVPQNVDPYTTATTLEGARQTIAQGPVASQEAGGDQGVGHERGRLLQRELRATVREPNAAH